MLVKSHQEQSKKSEISQLIQDQKYSIWFYEENKIQTLLSSYLNSYYNSDKTKKSLQSIWKWMKNAESL